MAQYQPNNTAGVAGVTMNSFANTLGQFLLAKINNDQAAKRAQDDDKRALYMLGFTEMLKANPRAFADPTKLGNALKEGGLKTDPNQLGSLAQLFAGIADQRDAEALAAQQQQARFDAFTGIGGTPPPPAQAIPTPQPADNGMPRGQMAGFPQPVQPAAAPAFTGDTATPVDTSHDPNLDEFGGPLQPTQPQAAQPALPPLPPQLEQNYARAIQGIQNANATLKFGKDSASRSVEQSLAAVTNLQEQMLREGVPASAIIQHTDRLNALVAPHKAVPIAPAIREKAFDDELEAGLNQQTFEAEQLGLRPTWNLPEIIQGMADKGIIVTREQADKLARPHVQTMYTANVEKFRDFNARTLAAMDQIRANAGGRPLTATEQDDIRRLNDSLNGAPEWTAAQLTRQQSGGIGFDERDFTAALALPSPTDAQFDAERRVLGHNLGGLEEAARRHQERLANQTRLNALAKSGAEREFQLTTLVPDVQNFAQRLVEARNLLRQSNEGYFLTAPFEKLRQASEAKAMFSLASNLLDQMRPALTSLAGGVGNPTEAEQQFSVGTFPTSADAIYDEMRQKVLGTDMNMFDLRLSTIALQLTRKAQQEGVIGPTDSIQLGGIGPELASQYNQIGGQRINPFIENFKQAR